MKNTESKDEHYMKKALRQAQRAASLGEVPIGCVIVCGDKVVGRGCNMRNTKKTTLAHAEITAIDKASKKLGDWRLEGCTMYVTLEPCPMCAGAIVNSRIDRVVFGVKDAAAGCCGSVINFNSYPFNHAFELVSGVCEEECRAQLRDFFAEKRNKNSKIVEDQ